LNPPDVLLAYTFFMWASRSLSPWHWLIRASFALQFMHSALHGSRPKRKHRNFLCKSSVNLHLGFFFTLLATYILPRTWPQTEASEASHC